MTSNAARTAAAPTPPARARVLLLPATMPLTGGNGDLVDEVRSRLSDLPIEVVQLQEVEPPAMVRARAANSEGDELASLSPRQRDLLRLLANGHTYASCAVALGISLNTVQSHVRALYRRLDVSSKAEAAVVAVRCGLADEEA